MWYVFYHNFKKKQKSVCYSQLPIESIALFRIHCPKYRPLWSPNWSSYFQHLGNWSPAIYSAYMEPFIFLKQLSTCTFLQHKKLHVTDFRIKFHSSAWHTEPHKPFQPSDLLVPKRKKALARLFHLLRTVLTHAISPTLDTFILFTICHPSLKAQF